ncbi:MAG: hypothetical protein JO264_06130 [Acidisphaera sp.]|nr:hypothetical protein [Acidisphaera sp.]
MRKLSAALLGAVLAALPLTMAGAAEPPTPGMVVYDAAGHPLGVLVPLSSMPVAQAAPVDDPLLRMIRDMEAMLPDPASLFAEQAAMMRQVDQAMQSLPSGLETLPAGGTAVVVSSFTSGDRGCSRTITYSYPGTGDRPQVVVRQVGDACGPAITPRSGLPAALPQPVAPGSRLIQVDYKHPAHPAQRIRG